MQQENKAVYSSNNVWNDVFRKICSSKHHDNSWSS